MKTSTWMCFSIWSQDLILFWPSSYVSSSSSLQSLPQLLLSASLMIRSEGVQSYVLGWSTKRKSRLCHPRPGSNELGCRRHLKTRITFIHMYQAERVFTCALHLFCLPSAVPCGQDVVPRGKLEVTALCLVWLKGMTHDMLVFCCVNATGRINDFLHMWN